MEAAQSTIAVQKRQHGARIHEKPFLLAVSAGLATGQGNTINGEAQQLATTVQNYANSHCG